MAKSWLLMQECLRGCQAMPTKRTMTLNLTDQEMDALEQISQEKDVSKTAVLRQALRLYQLVNARIKDGERIYFENEKTQSRSEFVVL
jgi:hypothetical protein